MSTDNIFTAAMVQMRTGLLPEPSLEQGTRLIREAAAQGAKYVLTPEVSNMMQLNRKALFEHLASEEDDKSYRETHSASYFNDFQARRLNIRYQANDGTLKYVYTLNNTVAATPRLLGAIIENYQQADGSNHLNS